MSGNILLFVSLTVQARIFVHNFFNGVSVGGVNGLGQIKEEEYKEPWVSKLMLDTKVDMTLSS